MNDRKGSGSIGIDSGNIRYYGGTPRNYIDIGDTHKSANMWETFPYLMAIETIYSSMYSDRSFKVNSAETCGMAIEAAATCTGYRIMGFDSQDQCLNNLSTLMLTLSEGNAATVEDFKAYYCRVSDYTSRWRIIGVFDGKLKLVRNLPIGVYSWDNKDTTTGAESNWGKNDWTTSRLMKLLNPSDYYTSDSNDNGYGQSLYWNSESGMCFKYDKNETCSCNFSAIGLTSEAKNKIAEVTWNLGGIREDKFPGYADSVYSFERGTATYNSSRLTSWTGKVGLVYPSDYLYANDFNKSDGCINKWTVDMEEEPIIPVNCYENIWIGSSNPDKILLTITPLSSTASDIVAGYKGFTLYTSAEDAISIYPVIYLKADSIIKSGSGRLDDPYVLA